MTKVTFYYDTRSRSRIVGEWLWLILNLTSDDKTKSEFIILQSLIFCWTGLKDCLLLVAERQPKRGMGTSICPHDWCCYQTFEHWSRSFKKTKSNPVLPIYLLCKFPTCEKLNECRIKNVSVWQNQSYKDPHR